MRYLLTVIIIGLLSITPTLKAQDTRFFYLAPIDGTGAESDPFRYRCRKLDGRGMIDLRPDIKVATGRVLCASNSLPSNMSGVLQLASSFTGTITPAQKDAIRIALSLSDVNELTASTLDALLPQLLIDLPKAKSGIWKPLQPGVDGKYKIFLGKGAPVAQTTAWYYDKYHESDNGLRADILNGSIAVAGFIEDLFLGPAIAWATTLDTETFDCANSLQLDCIHQWTGFNGGNWELNTNRALVNGASTASDRNDSTLATVNHQASATIVTVSRGGTGTSAYCAVLIRQAGDTSVTFYRYQAIVRSSGELSETELYKSEAGAHTEIDSDATDVAGNDILLVSANGTTIAGKVNGSERVSVTDSSISTGTYTGLRFVADGASATCQVDDFNAEDITAATNRNRGAIIF